MLGRAIPPPYRRSDRPDGRFGGGPFSAPENMANFGRDAVEDAAGSGDSITMGQLKANGPVMPEKQKTQEFNYRYDDSDTIMNELDEFYPYVEMTHVAQNPSRFEGSFDGEWTDAPPAKRREYMELQLEYMESPIPDVRRTAQGRVLYLLQGCFGEVTSPEMQLHWIMENAKTLRSVDGIAPLVLALREANRKYNAGVDVNEKPVSSGSGSHQQFSPVDPYDERSAELMDLLAMLYFVIEVSRSDDSFGEELMAMSPALPLVLFNMVAGLKDKMPKGYPVKKVLLLLWKTLLACLGGVQEAAKARALSRELAGLRAEEKNFTKATPIDIATFRRDTSVKYPTFAPSASVSTSIPNEKLAEGMKPIPARPNYHSTELPAPSHRSSGSFHSSHPAPTGGAMPMPGTPAPTPPQSPAMGPRAKKQQFQTDPTKPYVFPFSSSGSGSNPNSLVPFAIAEADRLYHRHAYISLGLLQMWEMREECMREERGLGSRGLLGFELVGDDEEDAGEMEAMERDMRYEEEERASKEQGDKDGARIARDKRQAARRLHRVEVIYRNTLPSMQSCVIVLLKLLLATVTGPGAGGNLMHAPMPVGQQSPTNESIPQDNLPPPSREEVDVARHREINSKAVSAILLLILKWFKASHILKFHYFAQLLFDSNCLLLVLKMFGLSDVYQMVRSKNEFEDWNFFSYCRLHCYKDRSDHRMPQPPAASPSHFITVEGPTGGTEEVEVITEYSWRNFFSSINFLKILQKMTKHRSHRTWMLSQYKSSQVLKRMLRVNHKMMQLQILKLIKSQMPWCGRKWRQGNMKVITSIYLNCRPELRDEWLGGSDQDIELEDAMPQEYALRSLITFYNKRHYSSHLTALLSPEPSHKRSDSVSAVTLEDPALRPGAMHRASIADPDVFPPRKTDATLPYNPDGMIEFWLHEYEDVLMEVFGDPEGDWVVTGSGSDSEGEGGEEEEGDDGAIRPRPVPGAAEGARAWNALGEIMGDADDISDSESVVTVGELGEDARMEEPEGVEDGVFARQQAARRRSGGGGAGENTWEHMSPTTMSLLQKSPAERRRSSSSGSPLRPVVNVGSLSLEADVFEDDDENLPGPMPINVGTEDERERAFGAVDEVEYAYGE